MPRHGVQRPSNSEIYDALAGSVSALVRTRSGRKLKRERFLANGGILSYEAHGNAIDDGLVEAGTPECRGPSEAILYQRSQDSLLVHALPGAIRTLGGGELTLLKNCRDAEGHTYGAQENYEVEIARGGRLFAWRAGVSALIPLVAICAVITWVMMLAVAVLLLAAVFAVSLLSLVPRLRGIRAWVTPEGALLRVLQTPLMWLERGIWEPPMILFLGLYRLCAFRELRRGLLPFLISRPIISGAGTLVDDRFKLSEKGVAVRRVSRRWLGRALGIFEPGNLCKDLRGPALLDFRGFLRLFRRRQRFQIGLSDSNMAQTAEYLKLATTLLVIDLIEAGALRDLAPVRKPLQILRAIVDGDHTVALTLQRSYLEAARRFTREAPAVPLEVSEVVTRWAATLDAIEHAPATLVGQLDWITKQTLIGRAGDTPDTRKKIDLKYHELATGYFAALEARHLAPLLVTPEEARIAWNEAPTTTPARARARLIRNLADVAKVTVGWDRVKIGGPGGKVIRIDDYRDDD